MSSPVQRVSLSDGDKGRVEVTCVIAREVNTPPGVKPIAWRLLTNRTAETLADARQLIDWYRARWEIEMLFLVLKEGCRVEALQLSTVERLERAFALFLIVSWRIARLMRLGRKGDGEQGVKTIWLGLQRVGDAATAIK